MTLCPARGKPSPGDEASLRPHLPASACPWGGTHVVLEGLGLTRVLTCLSAIRCCTVQVPEHTVGGRGDNGFPTRPRPAPSMVCPCQPRTHHHQECRKPGGSPSVMFFSHRICRGEGRQVRGCCSHDSALPQAENTGQDQWTKERELGADNWVSTGAVDGQIGTCMPAVGPDPPQPSVLRAIRGDIRYHHWSTDGNWEKRTLGVARPAYLRQKGLG